VLLLLLLLLLLVVLLLAVSLSYSTVQPVPPARQSCTLKLPHVL